jgi:hypothetical protein
MYRTHAVSPIGGFERYGELVLKNSVGGGNLLSVEFLSGSCFSLGVVVFTRLPSRVVL